jgi:SAM-dependent methyltransferase
MFDRIGVQPGLGYIDLGSGAMGVLGPLAKRVGARGHAVGVENNSKQLAAAHDSIRENELSNVEILEQDAYPTNLPREAFDLVHARFAFAPVGRDQDLLAEMLALTRPGGLVSVQGPDTSSRNCYPTRPAWKRLKDAIQAAFAKGGGDFNAGQLTFAMLQRAGLEHVQIRAAVLPLQAPHPYRRLLIQFATSLRKRILDERILSEPELETAIAECEQIASDPETIVMSSIITQLWGRKAGLQSKERAWR